MILYVRNGGQLLARLPWFQDWSRRRGVVMDDDQRGRRECVMAAQENWST